MTWCDWHDDLAENCGGPHEGEDPRVAEPCPVKMAERLADTQAWLDHTATCLVEVLDDHSECKPDNTHVWKYNLPDMTDHCVLCGVSRRNP